MGWVGEPSSENCAVHVDSLHLGSPSPSLVNTVVRWTPLFGLLTATSLLCQAWGPLLASQSKQVPPFQFYRRESCPNHTAVVKQICVQSVHPHRPGSRQTDRIWIMAVVSQWAQVRMLQQEGGRRCPELRAAGVGCWKLRQGFFLNQTPQVALEVRRKDIGGGWFRGVSQGVWESI